MNIKPIKGWAIVDAKKPKLNLNEIYPDQTVLNLPNETVIRVEVRALVPGTVTVHTKKKSKKKHGK